MTYVSERIVRKSKPLNSLSILLQFKAKNGTIERTHANKNYVTPDYANNHVLMDNFLKMMRITIHNTTVNLEVKITHNPLAGSIMLVIWFGQLSNSRISN